MTMKNVSVNAATNMKEVKKEYGIMNVAMGCSNK
jgi:hypothetical protein